MGDKDGAEFDDIEKVFPNREAFIKSEKRVSELTNKHSKEFTFFLVFRVAVTKYPTVKKT